MEEFFFYCVSFCIIYLFFSLHPCITFSIGEKHSLKKKTSLGDFIVQFLYFMEEKVKIRNQGLSDLT